MPRALSKIVSGISALDRLQDQLIEVLNPVLRSLVESEDTWHYVGSAGEPPFQNSWNNYTVGSPSSGWQKVRFKKTSGGMVFVQGMAYNGATDVTIFTLPKGYRPSLQHIVNTAPGVFSGAPTVLHQRIDIRSGGAVRAQGGGGGTATFLAMHFNFFAEE